MEIQSWNLISRGNQKERAVSGYKSARDFAAQTFPAKAMNFAAGAGL